MAVVRLKHERDELQQRSERLAEECARLKGCATSGKS